MYNETLVGLEDIKKRIYIYKNYARVLGQPVVELVSAFVKLTVLSDAGSAPQGGCECAPRHVVTALPMFVVLEKLDERWKLLWWVAAGAGT